MAGLKREFDYYVAHQHELIEKYNGKVVVIIGQEVIGVYDDELVAVESTSEDYEPGTFLVHRVSPGSGNYTQTFHSRVVFTS